MYSSDPCETIITDLGESFVLHRFIYIHTHSRHNSVGKYFLKHVVNKDNHTFQKIYGA